LQNDLLQERLFLEVDMAKKLLSRQIKPDVERRLWALAAGRCEFHGCNRLVFKSPVTQEHVNISEKAHIYSFSEKRPQAAEKESDQRHFQPVARLP